MSDLFYNFIWTIGTPAFVISASPVVLNAKVMRRPGAFIVASNHHSPYDVPLLIRHSARKIDFVSIVEVFAKKFPAWFYGSMNAFPLDRHRPDAPTVRIILDRLRRGRVVGMFPEGHFRTLEKSVVNGGPIRKGIGRISVLAQVPVIPVVVLNSCAYGRLESWLPLRRIKYGLNFGQPLGIDAKLDPDVAAEDMETRLCAAFRELYSELKAQM